MCLVDTLGSVTRSQIETIALGLYHDTKLNRLRPLSEVYRETDLPRRGLQAILRNPVLQRTALSYSAEEMERVYSPIVTDPEDPPSEVDAIAGSGPARPLIRELYELACYGYAVAPRKDFFDITFRGRAHADVIRDIYRRTDWRDYRGSLQIVTVYTDA